VVANVNLIQVGVEMYSYLFVNNGTQKATGSCGDIRCECFTRQPV